MNFLNPVVQSTMFELCRHLNNRGRKVVSGGKYVMSKTPMNSTSSMGSTARITSRIGLLKRYDESKRLKPTGGAMKPSYMLARKMIPRWTGSIPKAMPTGTSKGTTTTMAA